MQVLEGIDGLRRVPHGAVMSIGNFDGVHRGHQHILATAQQIRRSSPGARIAVVTFEPHPLTVLRPQAAPPRLTTPSLKQAFLDAAGVDDLVVLPPARQVLNLTAEEFWRILRDDAKPSHLIEGKDFTFGRDRAGNIQRLNEWAVNTPVRVHIAEPVRVPLLDLQVVPISSSLIRWLIRHGRVRDAAICLGRAYTLEGRIVEGHRRGRTIGVPTANLDAVDQLIPADGVYAGRCALDGITYAAAVSIGTAPTFGDSHRQIEAHLIGFSGDLYGRTIHLDLLDWTRDQIRFSGVDPLKKQLSRDIAQAASLLNLVPQRPIAVA